MKTPRFLLVQGQVMPVPDSEKDGRQVSVERERGSRGMQLGARGVGCAHQPAAEEDFGKVSTGQWSARRGLSRSERDEVPAG